MNKTCACKWITLDTPFTRLKGKRVNVYKDALTKQGHEGTAVIENALFIYRKNLKTLIDCRVVFESSDERCAIVTVAEEDILV